MTGQSDIMIGTPTLGRSNKAFEETVGYFINMVMMRSVISPDINFRPYLHELHQTVLNSLERRDYPFSLLIKQLQHQRINGYRSIYQAQFILEKSQDPAWSGSLLFVAGKEGAQLKLGELTLDSLNTDPVQARKRNKFRRTNRI